MTKRNATAVPRQDPKTGTWGFIVDLGEGPDGKRRQARRRGFKTKKLALEELTNVRKKVTTQTYVAPARSTVAEYLAKWVKGLPTSGLRPSTVHGYERCLLSYVTPVLGGRRLDQLTAADLDSLYSGLLATGLKRREGGLSPRSVRYVHVVIQKALGDAVRKGELARNVATVASPPSAKSTKAPEMAWWMPDQLRAFLEFTSSEPLGPLFRVAAMTGLRRGEVCGLRWSDVDLERGRIEVRQQLTVLRGELFFGEPKTDHGRRKIDLDPATVAVLRSQWARRAEHRLAMGDGYQDHDLVFAQPDGRPLDPESVSKVFDRRVARSKLPRIRFHDLRHSHVAHLIAAGEQPLLIARRVGHGSSSFTMDRYGHLFDTADSQAASAVAAMVDGAVVTKL
jgi:integrase